MLHTVCGSSTQNEHAKVCKLSATLCPNANDVDSHASNMSFSEDGAALHKLQPVQCQSNATWPRILCLALLALLTVVGFMIVKLRYHHES